MDKNIKENETPKNELEKETPKIPEGEKTPEPEDKDKQIESLQAQKEHFREKAQKAEEAQKLALEEAERLKIELETKSSALSGRELKEKYPYWDDMTEEEKREAKEKLADKKRLAILEAKEKWRDDYASLLEETKERIRKKSGEQAFKDFACSPENRGQKNLANLAKQFLYEEPKPASESPKEPENKPGLETATGGPKTTAIPKKGFTPEEARELRKRDPQKYNKLVSEGRMKIIDKK